MKKKVLFCTHGFPGTGGGGTFNLIKYLPRHGYEPVVLTNAHQKNEMEERLLSEHFPQGLRVYGAANLPKSPFRIFSRFLRLPGLAAYLDKLVFFPDVDITGIPAAASRAISLIKAEGIECIITSSPPESFHLIGLIAQKRTGCTWIAHFRDLWTTKAIVNRPATPIHARCLSKLERTIYSHADHLIANTQGNYDIYAHTFKIPPERMTLISNGYDAAELSGHSPIVPFDGSPVFRIGYMGFFDKPGFPWQTFLLAVKKLSKAIGEQRVELHIAGFVSPKAVAFIADLGLMGLVRLHGVLAHQDAFALIRQTDLMVVLHYETGYSKAIVPHKLYHYLGMRKPVLGIGEEDGEMASIIRDANGGRVVSIARQDGVFDELLMFHGAWRSEGRIQYQGRKDFIERYEIQELTARLAATITKTLEHRGLHSEAPLFRRPSCSTE